MIAENVDNYHDYSMQILTDEELPVGNIEKLDDCSDFHAITFPGHFLHCTSILEKAKVDTS